MLPVSRISKTVDLVQRLDKSCNWAVTWVRADDLRRGTGVTAGHSTSALLQVYFIPTIFYVRKFEIEIGA